MTSVKKTTFTGVSHSILPREGIPFPPCKNCFESPTRLVLIKPDRLARAKAKALKMKLTPWVVQSLPCTHMTLIPDDRLESVICELTGADPDEMPGIS